jgi:catechol 2,3-dioxygenase-like lactoylglutathione lyase family enzyme
VRVQRLSWLGTRTENYEETRDFFGGVLGLSLVAEEPGLAIFKLPGGERDYVEVFSADNPEAEIMTTGPVAGFLVDDVLEARSRLEAAGVEMLEPVRWLRDYEGFEDATDYGWFQFRAPDGNSYACLQGSAAVPD